jgi:hypothetical protein
MSAGEGFERAPDGIVPLVGYRMWLVRDEDEEPVFFPLSHPSPNWKGATRGWVSASCWVGSDEFLASLDDEFAWDGPNPHRAPGEGCSCGFYAMKELDGQLLHVAAMAAHGVDRTGTDEVSVLGRVELAGKVIEHELGYRAERARIVELIPLRGQKRTVEAIARRAGVAVGRPVRVRRTPIRDGVWRLRFAWAVSKATPSSSTPPAQRRNHQVLLFISWGSLVVFRVWSFAHEAGGGP